MKPSVEEGPRRTWSDITRHVLQLAARIGEAQIDVFDLVVLDCFRTDFCVTHGYAPVLRSLLFVEEGVMKARGFKPRRRPLRRCGCGSLG